MRNRSEQLLWRIRWLVALFMAGLVVSGATAIPVETEVNWLINWFGIKAGAGGQTQSEITAWLWRVQGLSFQKRKWLNLRVEKFC